MAQPSGATAASGSAPAAPTTFTISPAVQPFNFPLRVYLDAHQGFDGIAVGAFVFNAVGKLLIVQRAAHDSKPLRWEIPGGATDFEDESLLHAAARELWEESGLRATSVDGLVGGEDIFMTRAQRRMCKYSFMVQVEGYDVHLDPNEHAAYLWVTEEEARAKRCGGVVLTYTARSQEGAIYEAFRVKKAQA